MAKITAAIESALPFVWLVAALFGVIAAWHGLAELLPIIKNIWAPRGTAQSMAIIGGCLAVIARGGKL